jgi:tetratricopeptide (TPR) repeat protein
MATSPLELYDKAYRLQYVENRIPAAVDLYKRLIKEFPDANECGYAAIQLQKIKAQNVADTFSEAAPVAGSGKTVRSVVILCLLLSLGSILLSIFLFKSLSDEKSARKKHLAIALNALGKLSRNDHAEAIQLLDQLKQIDPEAIAPYELSADIYRKQKNLKKAKEEYVTYFKNNPDKEPSISESAYMTLHSLQRPESEKREPPPALSTRTPPSKSVTPSTKNTVTRKKTHRTPKPPPPPNTSTKNTKNTKKGILLVDPDSVSYF